PVLAARAASRADFCDPAAPGVVQRRKRAAGSVAAASTARAGRAKTRTGAEERSGSIAAPACAERTYAFAPRSEHRRHESVAAIGRCAAHPQRIRLRADPSKRYL